MGSKRYKAIKRALELARPRSATGDPTGAPVVDANSALAKYQKYKAGETQITIERTPASKPGSLKQISILPFAVKASSGTAKYICTVSQRVLDTTALATVIEAANHAASVDPEVDKDVMGFVPAKAFISLINTTQSSTDAKASQITGIKYDPISKDAYVLPFGASTTDGYLEAKGKILIAANAITAKVPKVRFKNEEI